MRQWIASSCGQRKTIVNAITATNHGKDISIRSSEQDQLQRAYGEEGQPYLSLLGMGMGHYQDSFSGSYIHNL
jgi:hypothetical protein